MACEGQFDFNLPFRAELKKFELTSDVPVGTDRTGQRYWLLKVRKKRHISVWLLPLLTLPLFSSLLHSLPSSSFSPLSPFLTPSLPPSVPSSTSFSHRFPFSTLSLPPSSPSSLPPSLSPSLPSSYTQDSSYDLRLYGETNYNEIPPKTATWTLLAK